MVGTQVGPYKILEKVGKGGMAVVYKGVHTVLEQEVAVKVLLSEYAQDPAMRERFVNEARIQAKLSHPHVVNILNYLEDGDNVFLIMEFIDGMTLESHLAQRGALPLNEAVVICGDVLKALGFMHAKGVIHRDIKPSNIMFTREGLVKVTDFGIAKSAGVKGLTRTGMRIGTLWYMSPEQIQGQQATVASDVYSAGVTLYQMVTGRVPFSGDSEYSIMKGHLEEPPVPPWEINSLVSPGIGSVVLKTLAKDPAERYRTCEEFARALEQAGREEIPDQGQPAENFLAGVALGKGRNPLLSILPGLHMWQYAVIAAGLAVILFTLFYVLLSGSGKRTTINIMGSSAPSSVIVDTYASTPPQQQQSGIREYETRPSENSPPADNRENGPRTGNVEQDAPGSTSPQAVTEQTPPSPDAGAAPEQARNVPAEEESSPVAAAPEPESATPNDTPPEPSAQTPVEGAPEQPVVSKIEEHPGSNGTVKAKPEAPRKKAPDAPMAQKRRPDDQAVQQPEPQRPVEETEEPSRKTRQEHSPWKIRK